MNHRRILIVGNLGLIGSTLTSLLTAEGAEVLGVDNRRAACSLPPWRQQTNAWREGLASGARQVFEDARDHALMRTLVTGFQPTAVVYLAALLASEARREPGEAQQIQVDALCSLIADCRMLAEGPHLVLASSSYVYGNFAGTTAGEASPLAPIDTYGRVKVLAEEAVRGSGLPWTVIRPAAVYGVGDPRQRFISTSIEAAAAGRDVVIDYPTFSADFTHVDDVAEAFRLALEKPAARGRIFNITREEPTTNGYVGELLHQLAPTVQYEIEEVEIPDHVPRRGSIDCSTAHKELNWRAYTNITTGVDREFRLAQRIQQAIDLTE